jgi:hypothetical protein
VLSQNRKSGFSKRRFENGDVLFHGAAVYTDAGNQLPLAAERRSSSHDTAPPLRHQREERLPRLSKRSFPAITLAQSESLYINAADIDVAPCQMDNYLSALKEKGAASAYEPCGRTFGLRGRT